MSLYTITRDGEMVTQACRGCRFTVTYREAPGPRDRNALRTHQCPPPSVPVLDDEATA